MGNEYLDDVKTKARKELADAIVQYGFVRANWKKLSTIVVLAALIGGFVGATFF